MNWTNAEQSVLAALSAITGRGVSATDRLEADLGLDSVELAELAARLRERCGVELIDLLRSLTVDELVGLTVGRVAEFVAVRQAMEPIR